MTARESKGPRLFVSNARFFNTSAPASPLTLSVEESHYIAHVLRLRVGDPIEIGDATSGTVARARIAAISDTVTVAIEEILAPEHSTLPRLTLLCALCKGQKNELICDWATELGCSEIIFWQASRSVVRVRDQEECNHKQERLSKIAQGAAQQSKQSKPPTISVAQSLTAALENLPHSSADETLKLVCSLSSDAKPLAEILNEATPLGAITLVIGPEGDLTPEEESLLVSRGFARASLGSQVLRSELAVVTALSRIRIT